MSLTAALKQWYASKHNNPPAWLYYQGQVIDLVHQDKQRRPRQQDNCLYLDLLNQEQWHKQLTQWLRAQTLASTTEHVHAWSHTMGIAKPLTKVRRYKRRVGCCYVQRNTVVFHERLIQLPKVIIDYVVIHELSHLRHPNHSRAFWHYVGRFDPQYKMHHKWLQQHADVIFSSYETPLKRLCMPY